MRLSFKTNFRSLPVYWSVTRHDDLKVTICPKDDALNALINENAIDSFASEQMTVFSLQITGCLDGKIFSEGTDIH